LWDLSDSLIHYVLGCDGLLRPVDNPGKDAKSHEAYGKAGNGMETEMEN